MQVLKKICSLFIISILVGCTTAGNDQNNNINTVNRNGMTEMNFGDAANFRVGMLLPLTGVAAKQGQGLRNAALMAIDDVKNPNMMIQFYDTKSTPSGARVALENAISHKSQMIIGPLTAEEVKAVADKAEDKEIPILTFSTNTDVLRPGVYSIGLLVGEQVDRMVTYAANKGRKYFALLVPDNNTGIAVARAAISSAQKNDVIITDIAFYPPETSDFSEALKELTNYGKRSSRIKNIRAALAAKAAKGDENAAKVLTRLSNVGTLGGVDFDAVLIPEHGTRLKSAVAMLNYYDVASPKVKIMGTSIWENSNLNNEGSMLGGWYPVLSRRHNTYFMNKYRKVFGETPSGIYAFAYDAVALSSAIANSNTKRLDKAITNPDGYIGINGPFRIFNNGTNEHSLDILEVKRTGDKVINAAPSDFAASEYVDLRDISVNKDFIAPRIFGKDAALAQSLIFGQQLPPENQFYSDGRNEADIAREGLASHKVIIP